MEKHYLQDIIEPVVEGLGYELVRVLTMGGERQTLQVMIENKNHSKPITVDDCAAVSRALSDVLDEKDPIADKYSLEVSSTGVDRPLTKLEHFERYNGYEAKIEAAGAVEGRKRFKGKLAGVRDNLISIVDNNVTYEINFDNISKAKLVLTDELWEKYCQENENITTEL